MGGWGGIGGVPLNFHDYGEGENPKVNATCLGEADAGGGLRSI